MEYVIAGACLLLAGIIIGAAGIAIYIGKGMFR